MSGSINPQSTNHDLKMSIIELNLKQPLEIPYHPFIDKIANWHPEPLILYPNKICIIENFSQVSSPSQFQQMITHLKIKPVWAFDLQQNFAQSYSGITSLIEISTNEINFLIDPFNLNKEIKTKLKRLMESPDHLKVMHSCFHKLAGLQRDFNIFAWPVVDTQIMFRHVKEFQDVECDQNNSLSELLKEYVPEFKNLNFSAIKDKCDFRKRPIPDEIAHASVYRTKYLLPALQGIKSEYISSSNTNIAFDSLIMLYVREMYKLDGVLYNGKHYGTVENELKRFTSKSVDENVFKALHSWRSDFAKIVDEPPVQIISSELMAELSISKSDKNVTVDINFVKNKLKDNKLITERDLIEIKTIIDAGSYKKSYRVGKCKLCSMHQILQFREEMDKGSWIDVPMTVHCHQNLQNFSSENEKTISKRLKEINKEAGSQHSNCNKIGTFSLTSEEIIYLTVHVKRSMQRIIKLMQCPTCLQTPNYIFLPVCNCEETDVHCKSCWKSGCPNCKVPVKNNVLILDSAGKILRAANLYMQEIEDRNCVKRLNAIVSLLRKLDLEIFCDFCSVYMNNEFKLVRSMNYTEDKKCLKSCLPCYSLLEEEASKQIKNSKRLEICFSANMEIQTLFEDIIDFCAHNQKYSFQSTRQT